MSLLLHIRNEKDFFDFLHKHAIPQSTKIFRGVSSNKYKLVPTIGWKQNAFGKPILKADEKVIFNHFKQ